MQAYELCTLWSGNHTEEEIDALSGEIVSLLGGLGITPKHLQSLGRRKLAYPILGNTHGSYRVWLFEAEPQSVEEINKKLRLNSNVVRHLIITLGPGTIEKRIERAKEEKYAKPRPTYGIDEPTHERTHATTSTRTVEDKAHIEEKKRAGSEEKKPSIEELDEKLDELLESDKI